MWGILIGRGCAFQRAKSQSAAKPLASAHKVTMSQMSWPSVLISRRIGRGSLNGRTSVEVRMTFPSRVGALLLSVAGVQYRDRHRVIVGVVGDKSVRYRTV